MPIAAAVVGNDSMGTVLAARDMAAERYRAAALDSRHHLHLVEADMAGIGAAPRRPVVAEDIRDLQRWTGHRWRSAKPPAGLFRSSRASCAAVAKWGAGSRRLRSIACDAAW